MHLIALYSIQLQSTLLIVY